MDERSNGDLYILPVMLNFQEIDQRSVRVQERTFFSLP